VVQFEVVGCLERKKSHAKAQSREESTQREEALNIFAIFLAALRLRVRLPFSSSRLKLNHYYFSAAAPAASRRKILAAPHTGLLV
jgi:hypothetical protein